MAFGWKRLIPAALIWIIGVAIVRQVRLQGGVDTRTLLIAITVVVGVLLVLALLPERGSVEPEAEDEQRFDAFAAGYPVPPMPGQRIPKEPEIISSAAGSATPSSAEDSRG